MNRILAAVVVVLLACISTPGVQAYAAPGEPPPGTPPDSRIWSKYVELARESLLGAPTSGEFCGLVNDGCGMRFERRLILWSMRTGAHFLRGSILELYTTNQYEAGHLGYPTSDEQCWIRGGCFQTFSGGSVYWSPVTGAHYVKGAIREHWGQQGWEAGHLGYPTTDEQCWIRGGCFQTFTGGSIYWSLGTGAPLGTGARFVKGAIRQRWAAEGWEAGHLGYPTSVEFCGLRAGGCFQRFQGGSIYWSPGTGAHFVKGAIRDRWGTLGWESLRTPTGRRQGITEIWRTQWGHDLGYPTSGEFCGLVRGGCAQNFERGRIYFPWPQVLIL